MVAGGYIMNSYRKGKRSGVQQLTLMAMFTAIILIMAFTPVGLINLPIIKATILHIPVIIGAVVLGPVAGAYLGGLFGLTSLIKNIMTPSLLSFAFTPTVAVPGTGHGSPWAIFICFVPRILVGITPWLLYTAFNKLIPNMKTPGRTALLAGAGVLGALTNTFLVMGSIFILFKDAYASARDIPVEQVKGAILAIIGANGIPEAIAAGVITPIISLVMLKLMKKAR